MKVSFLLPLAASAVLTIAFIIPDEQTIRQAIVNDRHQAPISSQNDLKIDSNLVTKPCHKKSRGRDPLWNGMVLRERPQSIPNTHVDLVNYEAFNPLGWLDQGNFEAENSAEVLFNELYHFPRSFNRPEGKPIKPSGEEPFEGHDEDEPGKRPRRPPGKLPPHPPPHHRGPHHKLNETLWQMISRSNYTTKFAEAVAEFDDLVSILNGTISNYTLFVPTNKAFEKIGKHPEHKKPSKELIKKVLTYHFSHEFYPAGKILLSHTIPSALISDELGGPQRLRVGLGLHGLHVNFYSRVIAANIFGTNGVIHAVDSILLPPPEIHKIISFYPTVFSTLELAAHLTNLTQELPTVHTGGTFFAPPNDAFKRLGPKINAFLFSPWGRKYLKALLLYHMVVNETLYSDAYYHPTIEDGTLGVPRATGIPKGHYHVDLPTLLKGKHLSIDISRFGGFIKIIINGVASIKIQDGIAKDGVIQVVQNILIPPKTPPGSESAEEDLVEEEMTVEQFKARFEGVVEEDEEDKGYREEDVIALWDY